MQNRPLDSQAMAYVAVLERVYSRPQPRQVILDTEPIRTQRAAETSNIPHIVVSPAIVHQELTARPAQFARLTAGDKHTLLDYLLSTSELQCITNIQIIPLVNGHFVPLTDDTHAPTRYVLASAEEAGLFRNRDQENVLVALSKMHPTTQTNLCALAPGIINVELLSPNLVFRYLGVVRNQDHTHLTEVRLPSEHKPRLISWLTRFWNWMDRWSYTDELINMIRGRHMLPTLSGETVRRIDSGIFRATELDRDTIDVFRKIGVPFLHQGINVADNGNLVQGGIVRLSGDVHHLLGSIISPSSIPLDQDACHLLSKHFVRHLPNSILDDDRITTLQSLPIFPVLESSPLGELISHYESIGTTETIFVDANQIGILPNIPNQLFLDVSQPEGRTMAQIIDPTFSSQLLDEITLARLSIPYLEDQPLPILDTLLERIIIPHLNDLHEDDLYNLRHSQIIPVGYDDSDRSRPSEVVDPDAAIAILFPPGHLRLPHGKFAGEGVLLQPMQSQGMFQRQLSQELIDELVNIYASEEPTTIDTHTRSTHLLDQLDTYFQVEESPPILLSQDIPWLPGTGTALLTPLQCRDNVNKHLFDLVLPVIPHTIHSQRLRFALGWPEEIPFPLIINQIHAIFNMQPDETGQIERMMFIIKHLSYQFGRGEIGDSEMRTLIHQLDGQGWVPISTDAMIKATHAVFEPMNPSLPFKMVHTDLLNESEKLFLERMGCTNRPTPVTILSEIEVQSVSQSSPREKTNITILLLEELCRNGRRINAVEIPSLLVPDHEGKLRNAPRVYFNNMDSRRKLAMIPPGYYAAHNSITSDLSNRLGLCVLSDVLLDYYDPKHPVDEDLDIAHERINDILNKENPDEALKDILAKQIRSGGNTTTISILFDEKIFEGENLLSKEMSPLHRSRGSLVICTDAVLSDQDLSQWRLLSQLSENHFISTLFHLTEVPMVVSGNQVLFLDPSRMHISKFRTSCQLSLQSVRSQYADHLVPIDGLYGFDMKKDSYNGTLIRLSLRSVEQAQQSLLSSRPYQMDQIKLLVKQYTTLGTQSFFFSNMKHIEIRRRAVKPGPDQSLFRIAAVREDVRKEFNREGQYSYQKLYLNSSRGNDVEKKQESWRIASLSSAGTDTMPRTLSRDMSDGTRFPGQVSIAIRFSEDGEQEPPSNYHIFSTLPLATDISLPFHVHGTFMHDGGSLPLLPRGGATPDSVLNHFLLSELLPHAYLFAMEQYLMETGKSIPWPQSPSDPISETFITSMYGVLPHSNRKTFLSATGRPLTSQESVFSFDEPRGVTEFLRMIEVDTFVCLDDLNRPTLLPFLKSRALTPKIAKDFIFRNTATIRSKPIQEVDSVICYLLGGRISIAGLQLMPTKDGELSVFPGRNQPPVFIGSQMVEGLFPRNRFLYDLPANTIKLLRAERSLAIRNLDSIGVAEMVSQRLGNEALLSADNVAWVSDFWTKFWPHLLVQVADIASLPLIPTHNGTLHISLERCRSGRILPHPAHHKDKKIMPILVECGIIVIRPPAAIASEIPLIKFDLSTLLQCIEPISNIPELLKKLNRTEHKELADWMRSQVPTSQQPLGAIVTYLPIWMAQSASGEVQLRSARDLEMLPATIPLTEVGGFLNPAQFFAEHSAELAIVLDSYPDPRLTVTEFLHRLTLPAVLQFQQIRPFKYLLEVMLSVEGYPVSKILVPNGNRVLVRQDTLYDPSVLLFSIAFKYNRAMFIHPDLESFFPRLRGIHRKLTLDTFLACAIAIDERMETVHDNELVKMARDVFNELPTVLSDGVGSSETTAAEFWSQLQGLRFVPVADRTSGYPSPRFNWRPVVSPKQIVNPKCETVAWTQKARPATFSDIFYTALPDFGVPSPKEVMAHLDQLAKVVLKDPENRTVVITYLTDTYQWLDEHAEQSTEVLLGHINDQIFLNVDDPLEDKVWRWSSASEMIYNLPYDERRVRKYLIPFRRLLEAAGSPIVHDPKYLMEGIITDYPGPVGTRFNALRQARKDIDIALKAKDMEKLLPAHRALLAAVAPHLLPKAEGNQDQKMVVRGPEVHQVACNGFCLRNALDFIYTGSLTVPEPKSKPDAVGLAKNLLTLLDISNRWKMGELGLKVQHFIAVEMKLIMPETLTFLVEEASKLDAQYLMKACNDFSEKNVLLLRTW